jgi:hypothetical protein
MEIRIGNLTTHQADLPPILREGLEGILDPRAQFLFLTSAATVLSGLCLKTTGEYKQRIVYPNLYTLVLAPAGAGKGAMTDALGIVKKIEREVHEESLRKLREYKLARQNGEDDGHALLKPTMKAAVIAGNTSGAMLLKQVFDNGEDTPSIIFETEIDVLTNASNAEFGNFSATIRQGFHNETMRVARIADGGQRQIELPKLVLCLSGTHDQFFRLITNAEDGLFSRFMIVTFDGGKEWEDVKPCDACVNRVDVLNSIGEMGYLFFRFCVEKERYVKLTSAQWEKLNHFGRANLEFSTEQQIGADANIKRHGLMVFKLAMTFTMLRGYEAGSEEAELVCTDGDFELALELIRLSYQNSLELLEHFPATGKEIQNMAGELYRKLPESFSTDTALKLGRELRKGERTVKRYLEQFVDQNLIERESHGKYIKVTSTGSESSGS